MNSEIVNRTIFGLAFVVMYIFAFNVSVYYHLPIFIVLLVFVYLTLYEYIDLVDRGEEGRPFTGVLYGGSLAILILSYITLIVHDAGTALAAGESVQDIYGLPLSFWKNLTLGPANSFGIIFLSLIIIFVLQIFTRPLMGAVYSLGVTTLGIVFIAYFGSHLILLLTLKGGVFLIWYASTINFMTDTAAYFGGKFLGRHPVGFRVSPNKTYEGYISGFVLATLAGVAVYFIYESAVGGPMPITLMEAIVIGPFISAMAVVGDLIESSVKRDARKKDSASLIPGHGGIWDLTDALYITVPAIYYYITLRDSLGVM
jgi:phosphatidate cytidylyltransferase